MNKVSTLNEASSLPPAPSEARMPVRKGSGVVRNSSMDGLRSDATTDGATATSFSSSSYYLGSSSSGTPSASRTAQPNNNNGDDDGSGTRRGHRDGRFMLTPARSLEGGYYDEGASRKSSLDLTVRSGTRREGGGGGHHGLLLLLPPPDAPRGYPSAPGPKEAATTATTMASKTRFVPTAGATHRHPSTSAASQGLKPPRDGPASTTPFSTTPAWLLPGGDPVPPSHLCQPQDPPPRKPSLGGGGPLFRQLLLGRRPATVAPPPPPPPPASDSDSGLAATASLFPPSGHAHAGCRNSSITSSATTGSLHSLLLEEEDEDALALAEAAATAPNALARTTAPPDAGCGAGGTEDFSSGDVDGDDEDDITRHEDGEDDYSASSFLEDDYTAIESVDTDNPQFIAIGIVAPPARLSRSFDGPPASSSAAAVARSGGRSPEQLHQDELLSAAAARDVAQEEHDLKMRRKAAATDGGQETGQRIRRRSAPALPSSANGQRLSALDRSGPAGGGFRPNLSPAGGRGSATNPPDGGRAAGWSSHHGGTRTGGDILLEAARPSPSQSLLHVLTEAGGDPPPTDSPEIPTGVGCHDSNHSGEIGSARGPSAADREAKMRMTRGTFGAGTWMREQRVIPPPHRTPSTASTAPPVQPVRKPSCPKPEGGIGWLDPTGAKEGKMEETSWRGLRDDLEDVEDSLCEPPSLRSFESMQSSSQSVQSSRSTTSHTSGIDLDEKTRERILARSAALQAQRPRRMLSGPYSSSTESGDRPTATADGTEMGTSLSFGASAPYSSNGDPTSFKRDAAGGGANRTHSSIASSASDPSPSRRPSDDKRAMRTSSHELGKSVPPLAGAHGTSRRPCDDKSDHRRQPHAGVVARGRPGPHTSKDRSFGRGEKQAAPSSASAGSSHENGSQSGATDTEEGGFPFRPVTTADVGSYEGSEGRRGMEHLVAQAGVPVLLPGAFAIGGTQNDDDDDDTGFYDSGCEDGSVVHEHMDDEDNPCERRPDVEMAQRAGSLDPSVASNAPLEAELYEQDFVAAEILIEEDGADAKGSRRPSVASIACVVCVILVAVGVIVGVLIPRLGDQTTGGADKNQGDGREVVVVKGWLQVGEPLTGPNNKDNIRFGTSVAISADGARIAVGLPGADAGFSNGGLKSAGSVMIFDQINGVSWNKTVVIDGLRASAQSGTNVALSDNGRRVAIGAPSSGSDTPGYVAIYEETDAGSWERVGDILSGGEASGNGVFGSSLSFSVNGTIVAIGDRNSDGVEDGAEDTGVVRIFEEVNRTWVQMGSDLYGVETKSMFGYSIALSGDGHRIAASSLRRDDIPGSIFVFDFNGESWEKVGSPLVGENLKENFGVAIAISGDGSILASGSSDYSRGGQETERRVGIVRSFQLDDETWTTYGQPLEGENQFDAFGSSVSLSFEGDVLAVGAPANQNFCDNCGHIQVFRHSEGTWGRIGTELGKNDTSGGEYGYSVALSSNGTRVVGAAPTTTYNGMVSKVGQVVVFDEDLASGEGESEDKN